MAKCTCYGGDSPCICIPVVEGKLVSVPVEPDRALLASMAMRYRHDFGLLDKQTQESIMTTMMQLHEEVIGKGFYSPQQRERYMKMIGEE